VYTLHAAGLYVADLMNKEQNSFAAKIKINATNQTCPTNVMAIFVGERKSGVGGTR
jgi:hypothetical protein